MTLSDLTVLDGRVCFPDGSGSISGEEMVRCGAGWGGLTVYGPLSYFGGGTQDVMKISSQAAGQGAVLLAVDKTLSEYRPLNLRGETITFQIKTTGQASVAALKLDANGDLLVLHSLKPKNAIDFASDVSYIKINANHGLRFNNSADTLTLFTMEDDGRLRIHGLAGGGTRALSVDNNGYLCV
tara:strand:+ start:24593 stop:25141 length:549 start_codon:yes stop_codon:yes gene_type:complete